MNHECLDQGSSRRRLAECLNHPRWHVWRDDLARWDKATDTFASAWIVSPPVIDPLDALRGVQHDTHAEAVTHATERARASRLAAVQSAEGQADLRAVLSAAPTDTTKETS